MPHGARQKTGYEPHYCSWDRLPLLSPVHMHSLERNSLVTDLFHSNIKFSIHLLPLEIFGPAEETRETNTVK